MTGERSQSALKVLLLVDSLRVGGAERLIPPLAQGLKARDINVHVGFSFTRTDSPWEAELAADGFPLVNLKAANLQDPRPVGRLRAYLKHHHVSLIHSHLRYSDLVARFAGRLTQTPVITTFHNAPEILFAPAGPRERMLRAIDFWTFRHWGALGIAVSDAQRDALLNVTGAPPKAIRTICNGVDTSRFTPNAGQRLLVRAELGLPDGALVYTTVAALRPGKGIEFFIQAAGEVAAEEPRARFVVAGDGVERERLEAAARRAGLAERLLFTGARGDVERILAASDVYVHPSLAEAWSTSILEAMASELPVLATAVGGTRNMIIDEQTGLLAPPSDAPALNRGMLRLRDATERQRLGRNARAWVLRNASLETWLDAIAETYRLTAGYIEAPVGLATSR